MWRKVSVVRTEKSLNEAYENLLKYERLTRSELDVCESSLVKALEPRNMIDVGLVIVKSALTRTETRGSHYQADYPERNDEDWLKMIEVQKVGPDLKVNTRMPNMLIHP